MQADGLEACPTTNENAPASPAPAMQGNLKVGLQPSAYPRWSSRCSVPWPKAAGVDGPTKNEFLYALVQPASIGKIVVRPAIFSLSFCIHDGSHRNPWDNGRQRGGTRLRRRANQSTGTLRVD